MRSPSLALAMLLMLCAGAAAQSPVSFEGKTITMTVGYPAGGGTDASARLIAPYLSRYLPGSPNIIVQNVPGADGITAMNHFAQQVKPDGLTISMGSSTVGDPLNYRKPQAMFDPTKFIYIGGIGRGGSTLIINKDAEKRLSDPTQPPVIVGAPSGVPRSGQQMAAWGIEILGWNARWVLGYRGTNDLFIALERGEIDMTASSNLFQVAKLLEGGKFKIFSQTGTLTDGKITPRSEFHDVPIFPNQMQGKIKPGLQQKGFDYWFGLVMLDKWLVLPTGTPDAIVQAYRNAFNKAIKDHEFLERGKRISEDFEIQSAEDVKTLIDTLGSTPPEAFDYINDMLKRQGIGAS